MAEEGCGLWFPRQSFLVTGWQKWEGRTTGGIVFVRGCIVVGTGDPQWYIPHKAFTKTLMWVSLVGECVKTATEKSAAQQAWVFLGFLGRPSMLGLTFSIWEPSLTPLENTPRRFQHIEIIFSKPDWLQMHTKPTRAREAENLCFFLMW